VRFELEQRVGRLLGEVDREGRVRRVRVDEEDAVLFVLVRGNQGEFGEERAVAGVYPHFGGDGIVLVESVDYGRDGRVARMYIERSRNVECARDRTPRMNSDLIPDKTLRVYRPVTSMKGNGTKRMRREFLEHVSEQGQVSREVGNGGNIRALRKRDGDVEE